MLYSIAIHNSGFHCQRAEAGIHKRILKENRAGVMRFAA